MELRLVTALALTGALFLSVSGAQAGPPVMDGKKVKVLNYTANGGLADNTKDILVDRELCTTTCGKLAFVYKPAKGAKGGLMFTATWTNPLSDVDLFVAERAKNGALTILGSCQGTGGPSEKVYLAPNTLKSGKTYVMVMYFFRSINETFKGKVEMGVPSTIPTTVPEKVDALNHTNCTL